MSRSVALALFALAACVFPATPAPAAPYVQPDNAEGPLRGAWIDVFYPLELAPKNARFALVASGGGPEARRFQVPRRRTYEDDQSLSGRVVGRLAPDTTYDVVVTVPGKGRTVLPAAFTARAPRFGGFGGLTAARGEVAYVNLEFAMPRTRFRVGTSRARLVAHIAGDTWYGLRVPDDLPSDASALPVTAESSGVSVTSAESITIVQQRRSLLADVDGARRACTRQDWADDAGRLLIQGTRSVSGPGRSVSQGFVLSLSTEFSALAAPATFTTADGTWVETFNLREQGAAFPGKVGVFHSTTCTVTIDAIEGTRIRGTFSAHTIDRMTPGHDPDGREVEIENGRFEVERAPTAN